MSNSSHRIDTAGLGFEAFTFVQLSDRFTLLPRPDTFTKPNFQCPGCMCEQASPQFALHQQCDTVSKLKVPSYLTLVYAIYRIFAVNSGFELYPFWQI